MDQERGCIGCLAAGLINSVCLGQAPFNSTHRFFYARNLKAAPLSGNISMAFLTATTFLFGGAAAGMQGLVVNQVPFMLSFLASMSREIALEIGHGGSLAGGAHTLSIMAGEKLPRALAAGFCPGCDLLELLAAVRERLSGDGSGGRHLFAAIDEDDSARGEAAGA